MAEGVARVEVEVAVVMTCLEGREEERAGVEEDERGEREEEERGARKAEEVLGEGKVVEDDDEEVDDAG